MSKTEKKRHLLETLFTSSIAGTVIGGFVGSGIEDTLSNFHLAKNLSNIDDISLATAAIGGVSIAILETLKYYNGDRYEGALFIEKTEQKQEELHETIPQPNLKGLVKAIDNISEGVKNPAIFGNLYQNLENALQRDPLANMRYSYYSKRNSLLADSFEVFVPFTYKGELIDPKKSLDKFFDNADKLYAIFLEKLSEKVENITSRDKTFIDPTPDRKKDKIFRDLMTEEINLAQNIALWAIYLSQREGVVGSKVRESLQRMSVTNPNYLAHDVKVLGNNILKVYDNL